VDAPNAGLLSDSGFAWLAAELADRQPVAVRVDDGVPVAAVWAARGGGSEPFRAIEAGVETLASHRGRGHGRALVAAWAARVRARRAEPLYSTEWSNTASRALAMSLGLEAFGEHGHLG
jgi:GNAT superfamily N-acetyltransferase